MIYFLARASVCPLAVELFIDNGALVLNYDNLDEL